MSETATSALAATPASVEDTPRGFTPEDEAALRESLKRCSPTTAEAAVAYRRNRDPRELPVIIIGIVERFVESELRGKLADGDDDLRLVEDLGVDSLTMMEIVVLVEDVVQMQINNEELRNLRTIGDVKTFIDSKVRGLPAPKPSRFLAAAAIAEAMPIQAPFLFLDEATVTATHASAKYRITGEEFFLRGHFKDNPVMPASIMMEALGQVGVLYLLAGHVPPVEGKVVGANTVFFTSSEGVRCHRVCRPGETLSLSVKLKRMKMPLATFEGSVRVGTEKAVIVEEFTLTFGYVDAPVAASAGGGVNVADEAEAPAHAAGVNGAGA